MKLRILLVAMTAAPLAALAQPADQPQANPNPTTNRYVAVPDFFKLPPGRPMGSSSAVAGDSHGDIWVVDRCGANSCVGSKLDLNAQQKALLTTLAEKLSEQRKALTGQNADPRSELAALLAGSDVRPLLCTRPEKRSLLTSYTALKRLLLDARLEPTILHMMDDTKPATRHAVSTVSDTLSCCARNFLGYEVSAIRNDSTQTEQQRGALMRQLTLRLLECALPLRSVPAPSFASGRYLQRAAPPQTGRSH